ncbi:MAG: (d)CMP kinase [Polyangiaceae bacterium]
MTAPPRIIAIDGPAGAGKSSVARALAERLGWVLLDTGALYRAVALAAERRGVSHHDAAGCIGVAESLASGDALVLEPNPDGPPETKGTRVLLDGEDVSLAIRTPAMGMGASTVSAIPGVRAALLELQRSLGRRGAGVVAEGRDIGTVVFPDAPVKFFLTASLDVRARRRAAELGDEGAADFEALKADVARRDAQDASRAVAPLVQAPDAHLVDSSDRGLDEVIGQMLAVVADVFGL